MQANAELKTRAVSYFREKAEIYNERYAVRAAGDLLWVRHQAILDFVRSWPAPAAKMRFLDLGCGPGVLTRDLAELGFSGVGLDASPAMVEHCQARVSGADWTYRLGDVEATGLAARSFDAAVCSGVIDYLATDDKLIAEAARLLKPGGRFILCFTNRYGYTASLSTPIYWLKKLPGMRGLASRLRAAAVGGKQGAMQFTFRPRKQSPRQGRAALARHGFRILHDRYVHFSLLPAPFCTLTSRLRLGIDEKLGTLDRTPLRGFGSCYIVEAELERA